MSSVSAACATAISLWEHSIKNTLTFSSSGPSCPGLHWWWLSLVLRYNSEPIQRVRIETSDRSHQTGSFRRRVPVTTSCLAVLYGIFEDFGGNDTRWTFNGQRHSCIGDRYDDRWIKLSKFGYIRQYTTIKKYNVVKFPCRKCLTNCMDVIDLHFPAINFISSRVLAALNFNAFHPGHPLYLADHLQYHKPTSSTCSSASHFLSVLPYNLYLFIYRAFRTAAPKYGTLILFWHCGAIELPYFNC